MEEALENSKESTHSAHVNGMNECNWTLSVIENHKECILKMYWDLRHVPSLKSLNLWGGIVWCFSHQVGCAETRTASRMNKPTTKKLYKYKLPIL